MKFLAVSALLVATFVGCSSTPTTPKDPGAASSALRSSTSATVAASPSTSATTSTSPSASELTSEGVGEAMGAKIVFYAVAKAAGMDDSATMDELASGICGRIDSGKQATVGSWMKDTFQLAGDVAAKVALAAIESGCPQFKALMGS